MSNPKIGQLTANKEVVVAIAMQMFIYDIERMFSGPVLPPQVRGHALAKPEIRNSILAHAKKLEASLSIGGFLALSDASMYIIQWALEGLRVDAVYATVAAMNKDYIAELFPAVTKQFGSPRGLLNAVVEVQDYLHKMTGRYMRKDEVSVDSALAEVAAFKARGGAWMA